MKKKQLTKKSMFIIDQFEDAVGNLASDRYDYPPCKAEVARTRGLLIKRLLELEAQARRLRRALVQTAYAGRPRSLEAISDSILKAGRQNGKQVLTRNLLTRKR